MPDARGTGSRETRVAPGRCAELSMLAMRGVMYPDSSNREPWPRKLYSAKHEKNLVTLAAARKEGAGCFVERTVAKDGKHVWTGPHTM